MQGIFIKFLSLLSVKNRRESRTVRELRKMTVKKPDPQQKTEKLLKQERMAKALRENLLKRKQQQRERTEQDLDQRSKFKKI